MDKYKIGVTVLVISLILGMVVLNLIGTTKQSADNDGCFKDKKCGVLASTLNASHLAIGLLSALFALGVYLIVFARSEHSLLKKLEKEQHNLAREDKLMIIKMVLDGGEQKVFDAVLAQDGITQQTLRYRTDLSKSKISEILSGFEKKKLIFPEKKGKTYSIHLMADI